MDHQQKFRFGDAPGVITIYTAEGAQHRITGIELDGKMAAGPLAEILEEEHQKLIAGEPTELKPLGIIENS